MDIETLKNQIEQAKISRDWDEMYCEECFTGYDCQEGEPVEVFELVKAYCVWQTIKIDGLEFRTQAAINVYPDNPSKAKIILGAFDAWVIVESCSITMQDDDGDTLDMVDVITDIIGRPNSVNSLPVADYNLGDWEQLFS